VPLTSDWDESTHDEVTAPVALDAGWHDVVIDHSEHVGNARALVTVDSGPDLAGLALPPDRLRPVEGRGERYEHTANHADIAIPDASSNSSPGVATSSVSPGAPPGAVVHGVEVGLRYDHDWQADLRITLVAPSGKSVVLRDEQGNVGGSFYEHDLRSDLDGEPAGGTWTVKFADLWPGGAGTIRDVELTVHTQDAGAPPITATSDYVSPVHDLGAPAAIGAVRWEARTPAGTSALVSVRAGATAADCAAAPWTAVAASGASAGLSGEFVQYQVVLVSDGDHTPSLEWIELDSAP
jgi:subtilisin-like proprotein convertase family protein